MPPAGSGGRTKLIANGMPTVQQKTSLHLRLKRHAQARECLFGAVHVFRRPVNDVLPRLSAPQGPLHLHKSCQQRSALRSSTRAVRAQARRSCITSATSSTGYSFRTCSMGSIFLPRHLVARENPALKVRCRPMSLDTLTETGAQARPHTALCSRPPRPPAHEQKGGVERTVTTVVSSVYYNTAQ